MKTPRLSSRRTFLGHLSLGAAGLTLTSRSRAQGGPRKLGVALVGLGSYSTGQLGPALKLTQHCRLAGVVTGSREKGLKWAAEFGFPEKNIYHYGNMAALADNPDIDIVYVVTPNSLHAEHVIAAAWARKHVITEKPMANSVADCDAMLTACRVAGVKLSVGYRLQFEPHYLELKRLARDGDFGAWKAMSGMLAFPIRRRVWRVEKKMAGGGPLMDVGIYCVQAACMAALPPGAGQWRGDSTIGITAREHPKTRPEFFVDVEEGIDWTMEFANGAKAEFMTSYNQGGDRFRAEGEKGWIEFAPAFPYGGLKVTTSKGPFTPAVPRSQQAVQMDDFALSIRDNRASPVPGEMGRRDMVILEAIYASAAKGGKRIDVNV